MFRSIVVSAALMICAASARSAEVRVPEVKAQCGALGRVAFVVTAQGPVANVQFELAIEGAELVAVMQTPSTPKWIVNRVDEDGRTAIRMRGGPVDSGEAIGQIVLRVSPDAGGPVTLLMSKIHVFGDGFGETASDVVDDVAVDCASPPLLFRHFAGSLAGSGSIDGPAGQARMNDPRNIAIDAAGNIYVADSGNHAIRRVDARGETITFAGRPGVPGHADGRGRAALFQTPRGIAIAPDGSLVVADTGTHTIRRITTSGEVTTIAGTPGEQGSADGSAADARFCFPSGIGVASDGSVIVADTGYQNEPIYGLPRCGQTIRKVDPQGMVSTIAGTPGVVGLTDGNGAAALFSYPSGVAVANDGSIWVADTGSIHGRSYNGRTIRRITSDGTVTTIAGRPDSPFPGGTIDGQGSNARFSLPTQIVADGDGTFLVADVATIRRVTSQGLVSTIGSVPGASQGVAVGSDGTLFASDRNGAIWKIDRPVLSTLFAGYAIQWGDPVPLGGEYPFRHPSGVAVAADGGLVVADDDRIVRVSPGGRASVVAPREGASPFRQLSSIAVDATGTIWATDVDASCVWRVSPDGAVLRIGGAHGWFGWTDGGPDEAMFFWPRGIAIAPDGSAWVADTNNHAIRRVTAAGVVSTVAGEPGVNETKDGTRREARFNHPVAIAFGPDGFAWVAESYGQTVRLVTEEGQVSTIAGAPSVAGDRDGTGAEARFSMLGGIAIDARGRAWVSDDTLLRIVERDGTVSTAAGASAGFGGGTTATPHGVTSGSLGGDTRWLAPAGLAFDQDGRLFVAESRSWAIKVGVPCFDGSRCGSTRVRAARK